MSFLTPKKAKAGTSPQNAFASLDQMADERASGSRRDELIELCALPSTPERVIREALDECSAADLRHTDESGFTALQRCAASRDGRRLVEAFLARGADPNAVSPLGANAMILAAMRDHRETARALWEAGADNRHRMNAMTAAGWARQSGHAELADILDALPPARKCVCDACRPAASVFGH